MRPYFILSVFYFIWCDSNCIQTILGGTSQQEVTLDTTIEIHSIPLFTETDSDVPCNTHFDKNFANLLILKKINDKKKVVEIEKTFMQFKPQTENSINVRGQIIMLYKNKEKRRICFDRFGDFYEDGRYFTNQELFDVLKINNLIKY
jgi:hypothetical protein